jgi:hypothetical protein
MAKTYSGGLTLGKAGFSTQSLPAFGALNLLQYGLTLALPNCRVVICGRIRCNPADATAD